MNKLITIGNQPLNVYIGRRVSYYEQDCWHNMKNIYDDMSVDITTTYRAHTDSLMCEHVDVYKF